MNWMESGEWEEKKAARIELYQNKFNDQLSWAYLIGES